MAFPILNGLIIIIKTSKEVKTNNLPGYYYLLLSECIPNKYIQEILITVVLDTGKEEKGIQFIGCKTTLRGTSTSWRKD